MKKKNSIQEEKTKEVIKRELKNKLSPEFINRIDDIIVFASLSKDNIFKIIDIELRKLKKKLSDMGYSLEVSDGLKNVIIENGYDSELGARPLKRAIVKYIEDPISEEILRDSIKDKKYLWIMKKVRRKF